VKMRLKIEPSSYFLWIALGIALLTSLVCGYAYIFLKMEIQWLGTWEGEIVSDSQVQPIRIAIFHDGWAYFDDTGLKCGYHLMEDGFQLAPGSDTAETWKLIKRENGKIVLIAERNDDGRPIKIMRLSRINRAWW